METIQQQKAALRRRLAAREQAMTRRERELSDGAIIYHVTQTEEYRRACTVFAFVGCGREIGTRALLERILSEGKELCVPLCIGPGRMECRRVQDLSVLRPGSYGIPEPPPEAPAVPPEVPMIKFAVRVFMGYHLKKSIYYSLRIINILL